MHILILICSMATHGKAVRKLKEEDEAPILSFAEAVVFVNSKLHFY